MGTFCLKIKAQPVLLQAQTETEVWKIEKNEDKSVTEIEYLPLQNLHNL